MDDETKKRIAEIRTREQKATMKPWIASGNRYLPDIEAPEDSRRVVAQVYGTIPWDDAEFIAHARQDVPFLLDALEKAHAEIECLRPVKPIQRVEPPSKCTFCDGTGVVAEYLDGPNFPSFTSCDFCELGREIERRDRKF